MEINAFSDVKSLRKIIALMPGNVYWKNTKGEYQGCNLNQLKVAGLDSIQDILGKTDYDLYSSDIACLVQAADRAVMESGIEKEFEEIGVDAQGNKTIYLTKKIPLFDDNRHCTGLLGISIDISERKKQEEQLRIAKKQAEEANELKTKFIQNMQHDVRTPLSGVYQYMEMWAAEETDPEKRFCAELMRTSTGQLLNMCNELVDFENIDYLENAIKLEPVDTVRFLTRVIDLNRMAAHSRGLNIGINIDPALPHRLKLDKRKLYRVLVNLVGNSLKFTNEGSITLNVKKLHAENSFVTIAFEVHDTGVGIPADKIDLIFEKFVRLNPVNQTKYKGSGLGLSYVRKFVDDMNGRLEVESEEGKGSVFRVILSLSVPTADEMVKYDSNEIDTFNEELLLQEIMHTPPSTQHKTNNQVQENIIDINASLEAAGDIETVEEVLAMLRESLLHDKRQLEACYQRNDVAETRKILHRLDGTLRYCVVPKLQQARGQLHTAIKETEQLQTNTALYNNFYNEIEHFLLAYEKLKIETPA